MLTRIFHSRWCLELLTSLLKTVDTGQWLNIVDQTHLVLLDSTTKNNLPTLLNSWLLLSWQNVCNLIPSLNNSSTWDSNLRPRSGIYVTDEKRCLGQPQNQAKDKIWYKKFQMKVLNQLRLSKFRKVFCFNSPDISFKNCEELLAWSAAPSVCGDGWVERKVCLVLAMPVRVLLLVRY